MTSPTRFALLAAASLLVAADSGAGAEQTDKAKTTPVIDGAWRWTFTMPDGTTSRPKLNLTTERGALTGTASFRPGSETAITNAVLNGDELRFQVVRQRDGREIVTTYTGKWSGKTIKGKIESNWAGESQVFDWEAQRSHMGAEGVWRWTNSFSGSGGAGPPRPGGDRFGGRGRGGVPEIRVELDQDGETLTGGTVNRSFRRTEIKNGSIKDGEVYFELERGFGDTRYMVKFQGKQNGDIIKGTMEAEIEGEERKSDWEARRVE